MLYCVTVKGTSPEDAMSRAKTTIIENGWIIIENLDIHDYVSMEEAKNLLRVTSVSEIPTD